MRTKRTIKSDELLVDIIYAIGYLNVDEDNVSEQATVRSLINAAVLDMEAFCGTDIAAADFQVFLTEEEVLEFTLPETSTPPLFYYRNVAGDWTLLVLDTDYTTKVDCGVMAFTLLVTPTLGDFTEVYRVDYVSGFVAATLPENAKLGVLLHVSKNYDVRMDEGEERNLQRTCEILWRPFKTYQT